MKIPEDFKKFSAVIVIAMIHAALTLFVLFWGFGRSMAVFDGNEVPNYPQLDNVLDVVLKILFFPFVYIAGYLSSLPLGPLAFLLNGLLWGYVIVNLYRYIKRKLKK